MLMNTVNERLTGFRCVPEGDGFGTVANIQRTDNQLHLYRSG